MKNIIIAIASVVVLVALFLKLNAPSLEGKWVAETVIDNDKDTLNIGTGSFHLSVNDARYLFQSNINQEEKGSLSIRGKDILLEPENGAPYRMQILNHSSEQLHIKMMQEGTIRIVKLNRSQE